MSNHVDKYFAENSPHAGLGRASVRSGVTFVAARGVNVFVQLGSTIVLARLLSPSDFGLVAMVLAIVGFAPMLIDLGTTDASIQKRHVTRSEISTLFWVNAVIGGSLTALLVGASGFIAHVFGEPALAEIAIVSSLTFIIAGLSTQHYALMRRAMQFRRIATIEIAANVVGSVVSVAMALSGCGYWSLVAKPILTTGLSAIGVWTSCRWVPGRPQVTSDVKELVGFGMGVTGFTMTDYLARSADRVALGYFYGPSALGYFQNAFLIYSNLLSILTEPLHNVAVSGLTKLRSDVDALKKSWSSALSSLTFFAAPMFAVLAITGQDVVVILLGPKWAPAGPLLCIFAVRGIAHIVERTLGWLHVAAGRSDRWTRWGLVSAALQLLALVAGLPFGPIGVAAAYTIVTFGLFVRALAYAGEPVGIGAKDVIRTVGPQTIAAIVAVAVGHAVRHAFLGEASHLTSLLVSLPVCLTTYLAVVVGIFNVTGPLHLALSLMRELVPMRSWGGAKAQEQTNR